MVFNLINTILFELVDSNDKKHRLNVDWHVSKLELNNDFILKICKISGVTELKNLSIKIGAKDMALVIKEYTLTKGIDIEGFYDLKSNISILQVIGVNVHICDQSIKSLQADCKSIQVNDSFIDKLQIGIFKNHTRSPDSESEDFHKADILSLNDCILKKIDIYAECKDINLQGCVVDEINIKGDLFKLYNFKVKNLHLWQNTNVKKMLLADTFEEIKFEESTIERILVRSGAIIEKMEIVESIVQNCYGFCSENFKIPTYDSWHWISKSAQNDRNLQLRAESNYQMTKIQNKPEKKANRFISWLFDFCIGYGYKPLRILRTLGLVVLFNTIIFTLLEINGDGFNQLLALSDLEIFKKVIITLVNNLFLVLSIFSGSISGFINNRFQFCLSIIQYLSGVILFAMFVNALYIRYKE